MATAYSQFRAMRAVTKASLIATFKSLQSVFFSLFFPVVLIWIFGSLGRGGTPSVDVAWEKNIDSTNEVYYHVKGSPFLRFINPKNKDIEEELNRGRIAAIINIHQNGDSSRHSKYKITLRTSQASQRNFRTASSAVKEAVGRLDEKTFKDRPSVAEVEETMIEGGRQYKMIDFFLPGMIGFSLIGSAVFGISFTIYSLRETLVLKRMYSTPIRKEYIILGESIAKVIFNLMTVVVLIAFGHYAYGFSLAHGWVTFANMLIISFIALLVFMGFGFFISAVSKNQNVIPIYANLFMFPQYFLSGTFFPG